MGQVGRERGRRVRIAVVRVALGLCLLGGAPAAVEAQDTARVNALRYSAFAAARQAVEDIDKTSPEPLTKAAQEAMQRDVAAHRTPSASRAEVGRMIESSLQSQLEESIESIHQNLKLAEVDRSLAAFQEEIKGRFGSKIEERKQAFVARHADPVFKAARTAAVAEQAKRLHTAAYPPQAEIDRADAAGWSAPEVQALKDGIVQRVRRDLLVLFEEVERDARDRAEPVIAHIEAQRRSQSGSLKPETVPSTAATQAQIAQTLRNNANAAIDAARKAETGGRTIYGLLPSVEAELGKKAMDLEKERWRAFLGKVTQTFDEAAIRETIWKDLAGHREFLASRAKFVGAALPDAGRQAVENYAAKALDASDLAPFRTRLEKSLADDPAAQQNLRAAVENALAGPLKTVRDTIARKQVAKHFPTVDNGAWEVPKDVLAEIMGGRGDYTNYSRVIQIPNIRFDGEPLDPSRPLLVEHERTSDIGLMYFANRLIEQGKKAWDAQRKLVDKFDGDEGEIARDIKGKANLTPDDEPRLVQQYKDEVQARWNEDGRRVLWTGVNNKPPNADTKYGALFPAHQQRISDIVHRYFTTKLAEQKVVVTNPPPTPQPPKPPPPENPDPTKVGSGTGTNGDTTKNGGPTGEGDKGPSDGGGNKGPINEDTGDGLGMLLGWLKDVGERIKVTPIWFLWLLIVMLLIAALLAYRMGRQSGASGQSRTVEVKDGGQAEVIFPLGRRMRVVRLPPQPA